MGTPVQAGPARCKLVLLGDSGVGKSCIVQVWPLRHGTGPSAARQLGPCVGDALWPACHAAMQLVCLSPPEPFVMTAPPRCLAQRQCRGTFNPASSATVGAAFLAHTLALPSGQCIKFEIW